MDVVLGRGRNGSPPDVGLASIELVDAMYRSARDRRWVRVGELARAPERVGHVWRVKPGKAEAYARRHATIWPELERVLRDAGVRSYTIYLWGELVVSHLEVDDYAGLVERFNADPVALRWEREFADVLEYPNADPVTGWPERLREVWSL